MNAVIFDMDGLMFDTERVFVEAWDYAGEKTGIGKAGYMVYKTMGMSLAASKGIWEAEFGKGYDIDAMKACSKEFVGKYYESHRVPVKPGLYELLRFLAESRAKLAVASSSPRWEVEHHLADAGVARYYQAVVCGDMAAHSKPAPDLYLKACTLLGEAPGNCFALEDSKNGILSASRAGCIPLMVPDLWQPDEETRRIAAGVFSSLLGVKEFFAEG